MANDFSTGKSIFVLAIVAGCFAILWPNVFYPMLQGSFSPKDPLSSSQGCCDVMFDSDVNAIKVMSDICEKIFLWERDSDPGSLPALHAQGGKLRKETVERCRQTVLQRCGVDIHDILIEKVKLGRSYKQMLDEIRSLNSSICLRQTFGVSLGEIGLPRIIRIWGVNQPKHLRQERPPHLRPEFLHPALREKGRAIPHTHVVPKVPGQQQQKRSGTPMPGMRPPMGGPGQVVPPSKTGGTMGIVMPMYTIGIIVFFLYTMMKLIFKKSDPCNSYEDFTPDPHFHKAVLEDSYSGIEEISEDGSKLGAMELDFLKQRLQETEKAMERIMARMVTRPPELLNGRKRITNSKAVLSQLITAISGLVEEVNRQLRAEQEPQAQSNKGIENVVENDVKGNEEVKSNGKVEPETIEDKEVDDCEESTQKDKADKSIVKVIGMETTESCEHGSKWSRPGSRASTPISRPGTPLSRPPTPLSRPSTPQNIFIAGSLPSKSQLLVSDSHIETGTAQEQDNADAVVLTGKVTLSLIGLSENDVAKDGEEDSTADASSNGSEDNVV